MTPFLTADSNLDSSMQGQVALLVGGTKGIGKATALNLAQRGARVVIVGRDREAGESTRRELCALGSDAEFIAADLSLMSEVRRVAEIFRNRSERLDVLIHSADVLLTKRVETAEGLEFTFALNYLSRFLLNNLLLDLLQASAPSRIIHVAAAGFPGQLRLAQIPPPPEMSSFNGHNLGQRANDVYGVEFASRLEGSGVSINILNPGMVDTDIRRGIKLSPASQFLGQIAMKLFAPFTKTPQQAAQRVVYMATSPDMAGISGKLWKPSGAPWRTSAKVRDPQTRQQLWEKSEKLTRLPVP